MAEAKEPTEFTKNVIKLIKAIPRGRVASYGQIAILAGKPGAARGVVWILHSSSRKGELPWHRVVGAQGKISFPKGSAQFKRQIAALKKEGVRISEGRADFETFGWKKKPRVKRSKVTPRMFS